MSTMGMYSTDPQGLSHDWPASADGNTFHGVSNHVSGHGEAQPWTWEMMDQYPQGFSYVETLQPNEPSQSCRTGNDFELYQFGLPLPNGVNNCPMPGYESSQDSGWSDSGSTPWSSPEQANGEFMPFGHPHADGHYSTTNCIAPHDVQPCSEADQSSYQFCGSEVVCDSPMQSTADNQNSSRACSKEQDSSVQSSIRSEKDVLTLVIRRHRADTASTLGTNKCRVTKQRKDKQIKNFICPFTIYGCSGLFSSKNEWKRHIHSQHMRLDFWRCDLCDSGNRAPNDFNRKDLFYQHIRRMHPFSENRPGVNIDPSGAGSKKSRPRKGARGSGGSTVSAEEEAYLASTAQRCHYLLRQPPQRCACLLCEHVFEGPRAWEDRLEHIGRHHEADKKQGKMPLDPSYWRRDVYTEAWLKQEGLIERDTRGRCRL